MPQEIYKLGRGQIFNSPVIFKGYKTQLLNVTLQHHYSVLSAQIHLVYTRFPDGASGKQSSCQCRKCRRSWVRALGWEDFLEEEMAPHPRILAWKIPWIEEPGGLQSMGLQRVRHY